MCHIHLNGQSVKVEEASSCLSVRIQNDTSKVRNKDDLLSMKYIAILMTVASYPDGYTKSDELRSSPKTNKLFCAGLQVSSDFSVGGSPSHLTVMQVVAMQLVFGWYFSFNKIVHFTKLL